LRTLAPSLPIARCALLWLSQQGRDDASVLIQTRGPADADEFSRLPRSNPLQGNPRRGGIEMSESTAAQTTIGQVATVMVPVADQDKAIEF